MPSQTSFERKGILRHAWLEIWTRNLLLPIAGLAVFLVLLPVSTAGMPGSSIFNIEYTHDQLKYRFFAASFGPVLYAAAVVYGIVLGLALLRFMSDRRQTATYFSLGLSRTRLLRIRLLAACLMLAVGVGAPLLVSLLLNLAALGYTPSIFRSFFYLLSGLLVTGLTSLFASAIASALAGTLFEAAAFTACLLAIPSALFYGVGALTKHLLFGSASGVLLRTGTGYAAPSLLSQSSAWNPLLFFYHDCMTYSAYYATTTGATLPSIRPLTVILWLAADVVLALLAILALKKRKVEFAGIAGMCRGMNRTLAITLAFFLFTLIIDLLASVSLPIAFAAGTAVFILVCFILRVVTRRNHHTTAGNGIWTLPAGLAAVYALVVVLGTGFFGYSTRIPDASNVASMQISYVGSPNYITGDNTQGSSGANGYYISQSVKLTDTGDIKLASTLHEAMINAGKPSLQLNSAAYEKTAVPYDITVQYKLKNGGTITRYYDRTTYAVLETMLTLDNTNAVKALTRKNLSGESGSAYWAAGAYKNGTVYLSNSWYNNTQALALSSGKRAELLADVAADVAAQPLSDRYFPSKTPLGVLMFSPAGESDTATFAYNLENAEIYVTDRFTRTLAFLRGNGLGNAFDFTGAVENITLMKYNPYVSVNRSIVPTSGYFMGYSQNNENGFVLQKDFGKNTVIDDADQIGKLLPLLQNGYFVSRGGYLAAVKLKGSSQYVYKFLPLAYAPKEIKGLVIN